jgi:DNA-binding protein HU-beta
MNKNQIIEAIAKEIHLNKRDCKKFLDAYMKVAQAALVAGKSIKLIGFATLSVKKREARKGWHPQTGKELIIPAVNVVKFSSGTQLKRAINQSKVEK